MAIATCVNGHHYDQTLHSVCPYCVPNSPPVNYTPDGQNVTQPVSPQQNIPVTTHQDVSAQSEGNNSYKIAAGVTAAVAVISILYGMNTSSMLTQTEEQLSTAEKKLENYTELEKLYGFGSNSYYAKMPIIILKAGGEARKLPVYFGANGTVSFNIVDGDIKAEWIKEWKNNWTDVLITPSAKHGYSTLHFTNKVDSASFDVLVVVK